MKVINFVNPTQTKEAYDLLISCIFSGFCYDQTLEYLKDIGYHIPKGQFDSFVDVCNTMVEMDLGGIYED